MTIKSVILEQANKRTDINKPMEDYSILDDDNQIYILADGTTRPHDEYNCANDKTYTSIAYTFAYEISTYIHKYLTDRTACGTDTISLIVNCLIAANEDWANNHPDVLAMDYPPTAALLIAIIRDDKLYYFNTCDTIGVLLRNKTKIIFTERHNRRVKREVCFSKRYLYMNIYNCEDNEYGYGMMNGSDGFKDFIHVGHLQIEPDDRIILSTDGMFDYLETMPGRMLSKLNPYEMLVQSSAFDRPPYSKYADDKSFIQIIVR